MRDLKLFSSQACDVTQFSFRDVLWLGAAHRQEMKTIKELHNRDVEKFRKQVDVQVCEFIGRFESQDNGIQSKVPSPAPNPNL